MASIHWFRKGLRVHDNPALKAACTATSVYPVFIIDPWFANPDLVGINRYSFLLESLEDLDNSLRSLGTQLFVLKGRPEEQLLCYIEKWNIKYVTFEIDTEPYAIKRDLAVTTVLESRGVKVTSFASHTLHDMKLYQSVLKGKPCNSYGSFGKLFQSLRPNLRELEKQPTATDIPKPLKEYLDDQAYRVPTLTEMGYIGEVTKKILGGETEALKRLKQTVTERASWVKKFSKPDTSPNSIEASTTILSPYLKFGCLSVLLFYNELQSIYEQSNNNTEPPVSLHGQLLWREFFYFNSVVTPNFDKMIGNLQCKQINWNKNETLLELWKNGQTGYPYIDAIMIQLKTEGWIHHLARHSVACFLTRGDLWLSWEDGAKVFDLFLLDSDWALNNVSYDNIVFKIIYHVIIVLVIFNCWDLYVYVMLFRDMLHYIILCYIFCYVVYMLCYAILYYVIFVYILCYD